MNEILHGALAKAKNNRGESITEVLVGIVVAGLAILMLAMSIAVSVNMNQQSKVNINSYYDKNTQIVEGAGSATTEGKVTLSGKTLGGNAFKNEEFGVIYISNDQANNEPIVSYKVKK